MTESRKGDADWTDASVQYYHKYTLKYLLDLDIVEYQEQPNDLICTVGPTSHFKELIKNAQNVRDNQMVLFESIFQKLAKNKGITLRKNLLYDMIKLVSLDLAQTSLLYYHERTLPCLLDLGIVNYVKKSDGFSCTVEQTPYFRSLLKESNERNRSKMGSFDLIIKDVARKKQIMMNKKLRYDIIKLMSFIDKFGGKGTVWITNG
jgi:hypothetical protein